MSGTLPTPPTPTEEGRGTERQANITFDSAAHLTTCPFRGCSLLLCVFGGRQIVLFYLVCLVRSRLILFSRLLTIIGLAWLIFPWNGRFPSPVLAGDLDHSGVGITYFFMFTRH